MSAPFFSLESRFVAAIRRSSWRLVLLPVLACPALAHLDLDWHIEIVSELIANEPTAALYLRRGELHRQHGDLDKALLDLAAAEKLAPGREAVRLSRALTLHSAGSLPAALETLDDFLALHPSHQNARLLRARVLVGMRRYEDAVRDFDEVVRLAPGSGPEPYLERAVTCEALQRPDAALASLEEGIRRLGDIPSLQIPALEIELRWLRYDAALARIDRLLARAERKERWHVRRAQCLAAMRRDDEARRACQDALAALEQLTPALRAVKATRDLEGEVRAILENPSVPKSDNDNPNKRKRSS